MTIAVDFDGTIVKHRYPEIGEEIPFAVDTIKMLIRDQHRLILWSVREGELLEEAVEWCRQRGIEFYAVNRDYPEETVENNPAFSRKLKVDMFIDDRNVGGLPDWGVIYRMISQKTTWNDLLVEAETGHSGGHGHSHGSGSRRHSDEREGFKKKWWQF